MLPDRRTQHRVLQCTCQKTQDLNLNHRDSKRPPPRRAAATTMDLPKDVKITNNEGTEKIKKMGLLEIHVHCVTLHWILHLHRTPGQMARASQPVGCWQHCVMAYAEG